MRILLTGGCGFIGKYLLPLLDKHKILMIGRRDFEGLQENISYVQGNISNLSELEEKIKAFSPEVCIHLAWEGIPDYSFSTCLKNFNASIRLFDFLSRIDCKTIFAAGTCWEYGNLNGQVHESDMPANMNLFASMKSGLQLSGQSIFNSNAINFIWGRFFFIYGPGQRETSLIPSCFQAFNAGRMPELKNPNAVNDFIYVLDAAKAIVNIIEAPNVSGVVNIGSGKPTKVLDVCKIISKKINTTFKDPTLEDSQENIGFWADISKMSQQTGWAPEVSVEEGIKMILDSLEENS
jgi:nucleoside-diphosphate-sugar epimerase